MSLKERLQQGLAALGPAPALTIEQVDALLAYLELLNKWNKTYNLTAIREPERMLTHHLLDSLAMLPHLGREPLLDVGAGAGLPGIPLAIARPDAKVTLLDAVEKKCAFMRQACVQLGLDRVEVVHGRVEAWRPGQRFAQIVTRAFSDLTNMVRLTAHLLAPDGRWLAMKGAYPESELQGLSGARLVETIPLTVPGLNAERHLLVLEAVEGGMS